MENLIDTRRLAYFVVVAEELHFTRAAERLHMAQPPLSYQIQRLEQELGVQLFERNHHQVQLTEAGKILYDEARRLFGQMEQTVRLVQKTGLGNAGLLTLGFVPSASNSALPPILKAFQRQFPEIRLFLKEMNPDEVVRGLHDHRIDVGMLFLPLDDGELQSQPVQRESFLAVLPATHAQAMQSQITLRSLADERFIIPHRYSAVPGLFTHVMNICREASFVPKTVQEVWLMQTVIGLVAADMGVSVVPASVRHLNRTGVVYKPLQDVTLEIEMGVIWQRNNTLPVLQSFLRVIDEHFSQEENHASVRGGLPPV
jgi:DNA-binding transcriptional LysR family regulator